MDLDAGDALVGNFLPADVQVSPQQHLEVAAVRVRRGLARRKELTHHLRQSPLQSAAEVDDDDLVEGGGSLCAGGVAAFGQEVAVLVTRLPVRAVRRGDRVGGEVPRRQAGVQLEAYPHVLVDDGKRLQLRPADGDGLRLRRASNLCAERQRDAGKGRGAADGAEEPGQATHGVGHPSEGHYPTGIVGHVG